MFTTLLYYIGIKKWKTFHRRTFQSRVYGIGVDKPGVTTDAILQYCDTTDKMHVRALVTYPFVNKIFQLSEIVTKLGYDSETIATMIVAHQKTGKEINV
jgi:hypothetical protein